MSGNRTLITSRTKTSWYLGVIGIVLLCFLAYRVRWSDVVASLKGLGKPWLVTMFAMTSLTVSLRSYRLYLVLGTRTSVIQTWHSVCLGYFGSLFLPLGGGEVVKVAALRYGSHISLSRAATALAMDRSFDVCTLLALMAGAVGWGSLPRFRIGSMMILALAASSLIAFWMFLLISGDSLKIRLSRWASKHPGRHPWLQRFEEIHDQATQLRKPARITSLITLQSCIFAADILGVVCGLQVFPFGQTLPASAAIRLALFGMLGSGLPLLPGGLGSQQAACILALTPYGVSTAQALALSLVGGSVHILTLSILGAAAILGSGMNPLRLFRAPEVIDSPNSLEEP